MAISEVDIRLIEKHLQGLLTLEEKTVFEQKKNDPAFIEELALYSALKKSTTDVSRTELREDFKGWDREAKTKTKPERRLGFWWKIAAGLLILVGIIGLLNRFTRTASPQQLFAQYYQPYPNLIDPIQKGDDAPSPSITQLYELEKYESVLAQTPISSVDSFYLALTYLQLDHKEDALSSLQSFATRENFRFKDAAQWYLALNLLLNNQRELSTQILLEISQDAGHDYQHLASNLVAKLQK